MRISKRKARRKAIEAGFRSKFEQEIAEWFAEEGINFKYEGMKVQYTVPETKKTYTPDWMLDACPGVIYESKGRFTSYDRQKMLLVRKSNPNLVIRMIFQNANVRISKTSKTTYADWCNKNQIEWCEWNGGLPKKWIK